MDEMQKYYYDYLKNGGKPNEVPEEYRHSVFQEICNDFFAKTGDINKIPSEYITEDMCRRYFASHNLNSINEDKRNAFICNLWYEWKHDLRGIPEEFVTQEMCNEYFEECMSSNETHNSKTFIQYIPEQFLTNEMCEAYFEKYDDPYVFRLSIPSDKKNSTLCNFWFNKTGDIRGIPKEFLTKEMCEQYIQNGGHPSDVKGKYREYAFEYFFMRKIDNEKYFSLTRVPKEYITQDLCNYYINHGGSISNIPEEYTTQEMCNECIRRSYYSIRQIPRKFQTEELASIYVESFSKFYNYTLKRQTLKEQIEEIFIYNVNRNSKDSYRYIKSDNLHKGSLTIEDFEYVPMGYITKKMVDKFLEKKLLEVPKTKKKNYLTNFYNEIFEKTKNINLISKQYLTDEMIEYAKNNPESIMPNSDMQKVIKTEENEKQIEIELYNLPKTLKTKEQLSDEYGVDIVFIDNVLEKMKDKYPEQYIAIQKTLNDNSYRFKNIMIKNIKKMSVIVDSLGKVRYNPKLRNVGRNAKALNNEQKIKLSYLLAKSGVSIGNLHKIYESLDNNWITNDVDIPNEKLGEVITFFNTLYIDTKKESFKNLSDNERFSVLKSHSLQYLRQYKPEEYFYDKGKAVKHSILDLNNNVIEITEENSKEVIETLKNNDIPLSNVIVKEAFRVYFREGNESLNTFIDKLHSYDLEVKSAREYADDTEYTLKKESPKTMVIPMSMISEDKMDGSIENYDGVITDYGMKHK